jgi:hypothetical protein
MPRHTYRGRSYEVLAQFDGENREADCALYIRTHTHVKVLGEDDGVIYVINDRDFGTELDAVDSDFGNTGWTSMLVGKA